MAEQLEKKASKRLADATVSMNAAVREGEIKQKTTIYDKIMAQPKVSVSISPMYKPYFGEVMEIQINGIYLSVPCDGKTHSIPECFADEVFHRIKAVDDSQRRADRMADIARNNEVVAGDINFF